MRIVVALPVTSVLIAAGLLAGSSPALAAPTCIDPATRPLCGGRVVAEAELSVSQHQFSGSVDDIKATLKAIEGVAPKGFFTTFSAGKSAGGRDIWVARVTDPSVPSSRKRQVAVSLSVHGLEPAGREGGIRYLEDLARWAATDPGRLLYAGDTGVPIRDVLKRAELYVGFTNPDGWSRQDLDNENDTAGVQAPRYNAKGADLNRDFPTLGWVDREATGGAGSKRGPVLDQPESKAWYGLLQKLPNLTTATDIHGELDSVNNAFSDLMWPAGQWSPNMQAKELQLAKDMIKTVERKFADEGVTLADVFGPTIGQRPANVATGYDVVGYDDSGFMGDAMTRLNGGRVVEIDV
ncbi:MAG TPA: M14 family zinc carboxypeptidase, partial [Mycobacteriales bacterium]|nr:M14 family zinc carboxypeptidase [Mycobacteriales bacterium]